MLLLLLFTRINTLTSVLKKTTKKLTPQAAYKIQLLLYASSLHIKKWLLQLCHTRAEWFEEVCLQKD